MVFSLPLLTPRPPVWQKTIKNTDFFFGTLPLSTSFVEGLAPYRKAERRGGGEGGGSKGPGVEGGGRGVGEGGTKGASM